MARQRYNPNPDTLNAMRDFMCERDEEGNERTWTHLTLGKALSLPSPYVRHCLRVLEMEGMAMSEPIQHYGRTIRKYWVINKVKKLKPKKKRRVKPIFQ